MENTLFTSIIAKCYVGNTTPCCLVQCLTGKHSEDTVLWTIATSPVQAWWCFIFPCITIPSFPYFPESHYSTALCRQLYRDVIKATIYWCSGYTCLLTFTDHQSKKTPTEPLQGTGLMPPSLRSLTLYQTHFYTLQSLYSPKTHWHKFQKMFQRA